MTPVRMALLGGGLFAETAHIPAILQIPELIEIVAVYSRTQATTDKVNALLTEPVPAYHDLDAVLADKRVEAVDIVLPIGIQPEFIEAALRAGKHVISEKPVAPTVERGRELITFAAGYPDQVWMVAENWRYLDALHAASEIMRKGTIGKPILASWVMAVDMTPNNPYYHTDWRRDESFPGGFLVDAGVHHMAAWRELLGDVAEVRAIAAAARDDLPPADTLAVTMRFENGALATHAITFASGAAERSPMVIVGEKGALYFSGERVRALVGDEETVQDYDYRAGVREEFAAFARSVRDGSPHRNGPEAALDDLELITRILEAANGS